MINQIVFGLLSILLLKLSYEDWQTKLVDVQTTLYASGFITGAYLFAGRFLEFIAWAVVFSLSWRFLKPLVERKNLVGAGDVSIFSFLLPAVWFANAWLLSVFLLLFGVTALVWYRKKLFDASEKPLVPIITVAWILTWIAGVLFF